MPELARRRFLASGIGAAGTLLLAPRRLRARAFDQAVYQRIWSADQAANGIEPVRPDEPRDPARGYVVVDERTASDPAHRLLPEVVIPDARRPTYDLARALFDNYHLAQRDGEASDRHEAGETLALFEAVSRSAAMAVAREQVEASQGRLSDQVFDELLFELWFRPFDIGRNRDLSGFEHVVVGEANGDAVSGHHFWYKYHLDDGGAGDDRIEWQGARYDGADGRVGRLTPIGRAVAEVVTLAYRWRTPAGRVLEQDIGGFFVGCSVEGLLALGTARFFDRTHRGTAIEAGRYEIVLHRSPDGRSVRTFYPRFLGLA